MRKKILLIIISVLMLLSFHSIFAYIACPPKTEYRHILRKALIDYLSDPSNAKLTVNELKNILTFYRTKDLSTSDCTSVNTTINKANTTIPEDTVPKCSDDTEYGECSVNKPKYCVNNNLISNCTLCGCSTGYNCNDDGTCSIHVTTTTSSTTSTTIPSGNCDSQCKAQGYGSGSCRSGSSTPNLFSNGDFSQGFTSYDCLSGWNVPPYGWASMDYSNYHNAAPSLRMEPDPYNIHPGSGDTASAWAAGFAVHPGDIVKLRVWVKTDTNSNYPYNPNVPYGARFGVDFKDSSYNILGDKLINSTVPAVDGCPVVSWGTPNWTLIEFYAQATDPATVSATPWFQCWPPQTGVHSACWFDDAEAYVINPEQQASSSNCQSGETSIGQDGCSSGQTCCCYNKLPSIRHVDFETGDFSQVPPGDVHGDMGLSLPTVVTNRVHSGTYAAECRINDASVSRASSIRMWGIPPKNAPLYYSFWVYVEDGYEVVGGAETWNAITEWCAPHPTSCNKHVDMAMMDARGVKNNLYLNFYNIHLDWGIPGADPQYPNAAIYSDVEMPTGRWVFFETYYKTDMTNGIIQVKMDGKLILEWKGKTEFDPGETTDISWTIMNYCGLEAPPHSFWFDDAWIDYASHYNELPSASMKIGIYTASWNFGDLTAETIANTFGMSQSAWVGYPPSSGDYSVKMNQVHQINPSYKVLLYRNVKDVEASIYGSTEEFDYCKQNGWLLKDSNGNYIQSPTYAGIYLVDIGNPDFQKWWAQKAKAWLDDYPFFDGVMADNGMFNDQWEWLWDSPTRPINPRTGTWFTDAEIRSAYIQIHKEVKKLIGSKLLIPNGIFTGARFYERQSNYMEILDNSPLDGILSEGLWNPYNSWLTEQQWLDSLKFLRWFQDTNRFFVAFAYANVMLPPDCTPEQMAMYSYASTLLGINNNKNYLCWTTHHEYPSGDALMALANNLNNIALGTPLEEYYLIQGTHVYTRDFTNGKVLVNPSTSSYTISLGGNYKKLDGTTVSSITMNAHTGEILLKT